MKSTRISLVLASLVLIISQVTCCEMVADRVGPLVIDQTQEAQAVQMTFAVTASAAYAEDCDAYDNLIIEVSITEEAQYDTWRSCQYYLQVTNNHTTQSAWLWVHDIHATETGIDSNDWYSWKIEPGATEERSYLGDFQNSGSYGYSYASEITAVLAIPECNNMREKTHAITIARPLQWFCGP